MSGAIATRSAEAGSGTIDPSRAWQVVFLEGLLETNSIMKACYRAGVYKSEAYLARKRDKQFAADWDEVEEILDMQRSGDIEEAVYDRAVNGSKYRKYDKDGNLIEEGSVPDTPAAKLLLRAYRPTRFKERTTPSDAAATVESVTGLIRELANAHRARAEGRNLDEGRPVEAIEAGVKKPPLVIRRHS